MLKILSIIPSRISQNSYLQTAVLIQVFKIIGVLSYGCGYILR